MAHGTLHTLAAILSVASLWGCPSPPVTTDAPDALAQDAARDAPVAMDAPAQDTATPDAPALDTPAADMSTADAPRTDAPAADALVSDAPGVDVPRADAPATDAPRVDSGACDPSLETTSPAGVCDGRGRIACEMWADRHVRAGVAFAVCVSAPAGCARANTCADIGDPATCRCGAGPACAPGQVCAASGPDATPSCRCVEPR